MSPILIAAAVIPAIFLLKRVNKLDKLDKESPKLLLKLVFMGIISTLLAVVAEEIGSYVLGFFFYEETTLYNLLMYFIVVGCSEEFAKYIVLKKATWKNPEFNCTFDGVVYAVFVSLGFALWENIKYVAIYGMHTALIRAVTAVPGHASFGVFMGVFYGMAKRAELKGRTEQSKHCKFMALFMPILIHGAYDFIATLDADMSDFIFIPFVAIMFIIAFVMLNKAAKNDEYIANPVNHHESQGYQGYQQYQGNQWQQNQSNQGYQQYPPYRQNEYNDLYKPWEKK